MADLKSQIVLVHGLWNRGWYMAKMAKRLQAHGHNVRVFSYPTRSDCLDGHANHLRTFIDEAKSAELHLIGHSMGGLVILNMLERFDDLPPGRVVLMGTPVKGSGVVERMQKLPGQRFLFGKARENLLQGYEHTPATHETGMIRGTRALGLGRLAGKMSETNDGSVTISETALEGLKDTVERDVSHSEMLVSADVVEQVDQFIKSGQFLKSHG